MLPLRNGAKHPHAFFFFLYSAVKRGRCVVSLVLSGQKDRGFVFVSIYGGFPTQKEVRAAHGVVAGLTVEMNVRQKKTTPASQLYPLNYC